tara:strand:+ start:756 stop:980 length:225 start_codon:yes stop_codon:yes gene_type:complete
MESLYYNNPEIKSKIDTILKKCSLMMANLGTNTPLDVNTQENAKTIEREWLKEVKDLDPEMYQSLVPRQGIEEK